MNEMDRKPEFHSLNSIVSEYEKLLFLNHPENPPLKAGETMIRKVNRALELFIKYADTISEDTSLLKMSEELNLQTLRLANLCLHLKASKEVMLLPAKRNYLYCGKPLIDILGELQFYRTLDGPVDEIINILKYASEQAGEDCQDLLEFRIINILIISLQLLIEDKKTICFLAQLLVSQDKLSKGEV